MSRVSRSRIRSSSAGPRLAAGARSTARGWSVTTRRPMWPAQWRSGCEPSGWRAAAPGPSGTTRRPRSRTRCSRPSGSSGPAGELGEALLEPFGARLRRRIAHESAQVLLEAVPRAAVTAVAEVRLGLAALGVRQVAVEEWLQQLLALAAVAGLAHRSLTFSA